MGLPSEVNALALGGGTGYQIERSVRLRSSASAQFTRTPGSAGDRRTWTWSAWIKRGALPASNQGFFGANVNSGTGLSIGISSANALFLSVNGVGTNTTTAVFRDPSAWYHIVFRFDTTQATQSNRAIFYVNGVQQSWSSFTLLGTLNQQFDVSNTLLHSLGFVSGLNYFDCYMAEVNFIGGLALTPSSFGYTDNVTGVWMPKAYSGTYGTNGFYLKFTDNSGATATTIGKDFSGNGNNWTPTNISVTAGTTYDSMLDSPTNYGDGGNGRGNYAVLNNLVRPAASVTWSEGNLKGSPGGSSIRVGYSSIVVTSGKWYCEVIPTSNDCSIGILKPSTFADTNSLGFAATEYAYLGNGNKYNNNTQTAFGATFTNNDVIGVALDLDNGRVWFAKNGTWQASGDPGANTNPAFTGLTGDYAFSAGDGSNASQTAEFWFNFGQRPFSYTPPSGFKALNTQNLPQPSIIRGASNFDVRLYSGNGSTQTISLSFTPDLVWVKSRNATLDNILVDRVRGTTGTQLISNSTAAETSDPNGIIIASRDFVVGSSNNVNASGNTYVGWSWDEGAVPGFDIVTYTGTGVNRTVAHNLGVAPQLLIVKRRNSTGNWAVWHTAIPNTNYLLLNGTNASTSGTTYWNSTSPTSSVFSLGTSTDVNANAGTYVAYLWSEVPGFSRFGSYVGNGSSDGTFVWLGFRPAFFLVKASSGGTAGSQGWATADDQRLGYNLNDYYLTPNTNAAEATGNNLDLVSNGVKMRGGPNENGTTYIYAAFAENPFKIARAR